MSESDELDKLFASHYLVYRKFEEIEEKYLLQDARQKALLKEMRARIEAAKRAGLPPKQIQESQKKYLELRQEREEEQKERHYERLQWLQEDALDLLQYLSKGYKDTNNPLFLWKLYSVYRLTSQPIPDFILNYFDDCALNLNNKVHEIKLDDAVKRSGVDGKIAGDNCLEALGLKSKGQLNAFAAVKRYLGQQFLLADIKKEEQKHRSNPQWKKGSGIAYRTVSSLLEKVLGKPIISASALRKLHRASSDE